MPDDHEGVLARLLCESHQMEPLALAGHATRAATAMGASGADLFVTDLEQRVLVALAADGGAVGDPLPIDSTLAGRAFISGLPQIGGTEDDRQLWVPMVDGMDRLGVLRMDVTEVDNDFIDRACALAGLLTLIIDNKKSHTDAYIRAARRRSTTLAAEMQWGLLPPLTMVTPRVAVAGMLEPAYEIGGDSFDYALNGDRLDLAILDAMGHGLTAAWPAILAVSSVRHSRRRDLDLTEIYREADAVLKDQFPDPHFVTAQIAQLDVATGTLRWINAGHPPPLHLRHHSVVGSLGCDPSLPLGIGGVVEEEGEVMLQPGDRVLFFTDGVTEGRGPSGTPFGEARLIDSLERAALAELEPAETMRRLAHAVIDHHDHHLSDDFTLLLVQYRGPS